MSEKPCGCGQVQPLDNSNLVTEATKPEIVPLPPELQAQNHARRATFQEQLPDYLREILVSVPEDAELKNED